MNIMEILRILFIGYPVTDEFIDPNYPAFLQKFGGLSLTLMITCLSMIFGTVLGIILAIFRNAPERNLKNQGGASGINRLLLHYTGTIIVQVIRGIPIMILVLLAFYLPYRLFSWRVPAVILAILAFSLYSGVYLCDVFRAGFRAVDSKWLETAGVLGLSRSQIYLTIKLPIALRAMTPALLGMTITVFKDTSVLAVVAIPEMTRSARLMHTAEPVNYALILGLVLLIYWSLATFGAVLVDRLDRSWRKNLNV